MKICRFLAACIVFVSVFFISSCTYEGSSEGDFFTSKLRGTWVSHDPDAVYQGRLVIDYNRITISGYGSNQTPWFGGNDDERPFRDFTRDAVLKGYSEKSVNEELTGSSEEGYIYIEDAGKLQDGILYLYYEDQAHNKFLRFTFGDRDETLRYTVETVE